jgi:hypothetical protein
MRYATILQVEATPAMTARAVDVDLEPTAAISPKVVKGRACSMARRYAPSSAALDELAGFLAKYRRS